MMTDLAAWRREFPILESTTYLISNSLGAMPRGAGARLAEYAEMWATHGVRAWDEGWWEMPVSVGDLVAPIIGAPAGSVTMHLNVTSAEAVVLSCFPADGKRNKIVFEEGNFPSVQYFYAAQPHLRVTPVPLARVADSIDDGTLLVPISHVLYKSSEMQDVSAIVEKAHRVGAYVVLDCSQSAGIVPVDLTALGVDFAVGGTLKWLCGGPGNAWLYVRPDLHHLRPGLTGWMAHAEPMSFAPPPTRYAEGPARFLNGTPNIPGLYAATEGLRIIREVGLQRIREHSVGLTERLLGKIRELGFPTVTPGDPDRRGGSVSVNPIDAEAIVRALLQRNVLVDHRPGAGIRLSPHFYNTADECDLVIGEIAALAAHRPSLRLTLG